jgi:hypothetical protein
MEAVNAEIPASIIFCGMWQLTPVVEAFAGPESVSQTLRNGVKCQA